MESDVRGQGLRVVAAVVAGVGILVGLTIWGQFEGHDAAALLVLDIAVGLLDLALLPVLLRYPVAGALALALLAASRPRPPRRQR